MERGKENKLGFAIQIWLYKILCHTESKNRHKRAYIMSFKFVYTHTFLIQKYI